ncbi:MAG: HEAT repeat domain-containing protein [Deltaproteobacteria bacterium]|nr:HEAT repeat domain-containing protein [Deltaproteobacteria bacterium]
MGLKDLLFPSKELRDENRLRKLAKKAAQKYLVKEERQEAIDQLVRLGTAEACAALLPRFAVAIDNTTVDEMEKTAVYDGLVSLGDTAIEPTVKALATAQSITWIVKTLAALVSKERVVGELTRVLTDLDHGYDRGNERRVQFIQHLGELGDARAIEILLPKLDDFDQNVRVVAIEALERIGDERACGALAERIATDESVRIRTRALEAIAHCGWSVGDKREMVEGRLPPDFVIDGEGRVRNRVRVFQEAMASDTRTKKRALKEVHLIQAVEEIVPLLLEAASDNDAEVRWRCAQHLGKIGDPRAVPALKRLREDPVSDVRKRAEEALRNFPIETP